MSYGVRSLLAFWLGGAAIPTEAAPVATPPRFTGHAGGLFLNPQSAFRRPRKFGEFSRRKFAKWKSDRSRG